ncbi:MAG: MBL fold metallo-hydrolase [Anaerolineae bacterium]|nr:MBL fold metallo-hydrolase [Anaerolineae bacterium]
MLINWYGTAGFRVETGGRVFLIDPYLSRNAEACPVLSFGPEGVTEGDEIFLSHGHFDHMADVPQIARQTGAAVYCSAEAAGALRRQGVTDAQLVVARDGDGFDLGVYRAQCFHSTHVRFDLPLVVSTFLRSIPSILTRPRLLPRPRHWPQGQALSWRFTLAAENDRVVHHFGSAGCTEDELARLTKLGAPDVLLFPLQGHSQICEIAARVVEWLRPRVVIPHHHDDFYPPISQAVDIAPFVEAVRKLSPPVEVVALTVCEPAKV